MVFPQVSTGVPGLDAILSGGYLAACPTLVSGRPGCGKTLFLLQFLAEGARHGHRAVCATCSEAPERLQAYMTALGHPTDQWVADGVLVFVDLRPVPGEVVAGTLEQEVVKIRLDAALTVDGTIAPEARLAIDDLNRLAYAFDPDGTARDSTLALLRLLRESRVTTLIAAAENEDTRATLADYAVDAVIELRQAVETRLMTRMLRVQKMRGVAHGTNEYPFMIDAAGPSLMPVTQLLGHYRSRQDRVSTGNARLDGLLGGGLYRGSSLMITGTSGTGKSTLLGTMAGGLAAAGLSTIYLTFEQDEAELVHDFDGVGIRLQPHIDAGTLRFQRARSVDCGLEEHLIRLARLVETEDPAVLIIDAVTALGDLGDISTVKSMVLRLIDACKSHGVTVLMSELVADSHEMVSQLGLSSLLDTWIRLELYRQSGEYVRLIRVLKGRGSRTSQQIKEFLITDEGICIEDPYVGGGSFVFGTDKLLREQAERREMAAMRARLDRLKRQLELLPRTYDARIAQTQLERDEALETLYGEIASLEDSLSGTSQDAGLIRKARDGA